MGKPIEDFQNVVPLEKVALTKTVKVDTPDSAPTEAGESPVKPDAVPENNPPSPGKVLPEKPRQGHTSRAKSSRQPKSARIGQPAVPIEFTFKRLRNGSHPPGRSGMLRPRESTA